MGKEKLLDIEFKDGRRITLRPSTGEIQKAIEAFKKGEKMIEISERGRDFYEPIVFSTSELRALIPRSVETRTEPTPKPKDLPIRTEKKSKLRGRMGV